MILRPPGSPLFPYTTLFRSLRADGVAILYISHRLDEMAEIVDRVTVLRDGRHIATTDLGHFVEPMRSEEHTSELQSQSNFVCRLLLEKKKNQLQYFKGSCVV